MMYRLWKFLFGWDYIQWENSIAQGVSRVHTLPDGRTVYWRYKSTKVMDEIKTPDQVFWLTCNPFKYLREPNQ